MGALLLVGLALGTAACASGPGGASDPGSAVSPGTRSGSADSAERLRLAVETAHPGIAAISPLSLAGSEGTPDASSQLTVVVEASADDDAVLEVAADLPGFADEAAWPGRVDLQRAGGGYEGDMRVSAPWRITVVPSSAEVGSSSEDAPSTEDVLVDVLALEDVEGVQSTVVQDGWRYVGVSDLDRFDGVVRTASALPTFAGGASYDLGGEEPRLTIVDVPSRVSDGFIAEVVSIAVDHPTAEVLLQATTYEPQWPTLYVARLSPEEQTALDVRLRDAALQHADPDGFPLPFVLSSIGQTGRTDVTGNVGDVPEEGVGRAG